MLKVCDLKAATLIITSTSITVDIIRMELNSVRVITCMELSLSRKSYSLVVVLTLALEDIFLCVGFGSVILEVGRMQGAGAGWMYLFAESECGRILSRKLRGTEAAARQTLSSGLGAGQGSIRAALSYPHDRQISATSCGFCILYIMHFYTNEEDLIVCIPIIINYFLLKSLHPTKTSICSD